jgi:NADH-quinone oxidoreductase subunit G
LQDLAVGYGGSASRYTEPKRVVFHKDLGPLVSAEEMTRCIQCTRCVRFGSEIAGIMELGMIGRSEHAEIVSFVGKTVDSELSGNSIDLCPVGALTSKPFRYAARTWELSRRKSVSPHDSLGSNLIVQVKGERVLRVLPLENEAINECWLSDKDRFSYDGLNSSDRLQQPMVKRDGKWEEVDWEQAFDFVVPRLKDFGILASPHATLEELFLAARLGPADFRLRHSDFSADGKREGIPWLGMPIAGLAALDQVLVVGSFLRKEAPLIAHRLRQAARRGARIHMLHSVDDDWLMPVASKKIVPPSELLGAIPGFADVLKAGKNAAVLIGNFAQQHPQAGAIHAAAQALAQVTGAKLGFIGEAANSVGGYVAGLPTASVHEVTRKKALVLLNVEPQLDLADPQALRHAECVVMLTPWKPAIDRADVLLPIAPFTETSGSFVNIEGRLQSFHATVNPLGEARPAWKVLRVLGSLLHLPGFEFDSIDQVRAACLAGRDLGSLLSNGIRAGSESVSAPASGIQRIADVPIYFADPLVRRSPPLQKTRDARAPRARMNARLMEKLGISSGQPVGVNGVRIGSVLDEAVPDGCVRIAAAHPSTAAVGPMFGTLTLEKVEAERAA